MKLLHCLSDDKAPSREYWCNYTEKAEKIIQRVAELEEKLSLYFLNIFPDEWDIMSLEKRDEYVEKHEFDVKINGFFCHPDTTVVDDDLLWLKDYREVENIRIVSSSLTSKSLECLNNKPQIRTLCITGTQFGDEMLDYILAMPGLELLDLYNTSVTPEAIKKIQKAFGDKLGLYVENAKLK